MSLQPLLATLIVATLGLTAYVGSVSRQVRQLVYGTSSYAQTACPADQVRCFSSSTDTAGWCQMSPCPPQMTTTTTTATTCPAAPTGCTWGIHTEPAPTGSTCPTTYCEPLPIDQASCTSRGGNWCASSMGGSGWCQQGVCPTQTPTTTDPVTTCAQSAGLWCPPSGNMTTGWCAFPPQTCTSTSTTTTCPTGQVQCPAMGTSPAGCYTTCPTSTIPPACTAGQMRCYYTGDTVGYCHTGTTCPTSPSSCATGMYTCTATPPATGYYCSSTQCSTTGCTAGQQWCPPSGGTAAGYCAVTCATTSTCPAGQVQCPAMGTSLAGCYTTCPTATIPIACTAGQMRCYYTGDTVGYCHTGTTCPSSPSSCAAGMYTCTATPPATGYYCSSTQCSTTGCTAGQQWCPPSGGSKAGYCASSCSTTTPVGPTPESCKTQNQYYCAPSPGSYSGTGWCSSTPCTQSECTTAGKKWCDPMPMTGTITGTQPQGWCTENTSTCPAYTEAGCTAQKGLWCKNPPNSPAATMGGSNGWCQTGGGTCPAYDAASCKAQSGSWCQPSGGGMGWCATGGSTCPDENKEKTDCATRGGEWCLSSGGGMGWCASGGSRCPANDATTCSARGGKWCKNAPSTYATAANMPSGWCSEPPSGGSAMSTYWKPSCPIYDAAECKTEGGLWCTGSGGGMGWCWTMPQGSYATASPPPGCNPGGEVVPPGPKVCPLMPYIQCPKGYKEVIEKNNDGCSFQRCIQPGGEDLPIYCPAVMPPPCPGGTLEAKKGANNCPVYECRASECKPPPPAEHCVTGWQPVPVPGLNCPRYDCPNTDHNRMEECVLKAIGKEAFERMKKGASPTPELMLKMQVCFDRQPKPPVPPRPRPPGEPPFPDQCPLQDMKRDMQRGLTRELERIDREIDGFRRQGVEIPVTYEGLLAKVKLIISQAAAATSCEEMYTFGQDLPDLMRQLHEQIQGIEQLARVNEVIKKLNKILNKEIEPQGKRAIRRVPKGRRAEMEKEFADRIAEFKAAIAAVKSAAESNDPDKVESAIEQAFEQLERARQTIQVAEMLRTVRRVFSAGRADIRQAEELIEKLEPENSADLTEALDEFKLVYAEARKMARTCLSTKAGENCADLFERYLVAWDDLEGAMKDTTGENDDLDDLLDLRLGKKLQESKTLQLLEVTR